MKSDTGHDFSIKDVEILDNETCFDGFLSISRIRLRHRLYAGGWSQAFSRELMCRRPGVGVLLYDPVLDKVVLVQQFRVGCLDDEQNGPWAIELVAGIVDADESPEDVAIREAQEEAKLGIRTLIPVCQYYNSPGGSNEKLWIFCAGVDADKAGGIHGLADENEDIQTLVMSRTEAEAAVAAGRINNAMSIIAIQWLGLNLERVKRMLTRA
ncbi:MAG: NUDIX domain-containing protein [Pseudomonadales bacterium]|nr:NUDIX domain-containing protein [Pseudomonadales bacterium]